ncbi:CRISPR-associated helicase/endonuclease Cas3 [Candidatus Viridilinea mediisalina]|uniref:HD Cas3-type domain-containing protein n=1 Tax=Candidatus Viridilinea mediisalina TaxID=2024553 RepID=A0A2A6REV4_9CHLR|nr:CRISPR-associated helicase/endonuclease Cas3 [Candidatus Viridilinea mediisalina]PDW01463.1 hypothetical protein CJ255_19055 [Candidatus Viridilinea mediisalina]
MTLDPLLIQFWGKTPKRDAPVSDFHPAIFHMLDVALVAEALLRAGAPRLRWALLHAWRGCDPAALVAWLPFLIATHDLGKVAAGFQAQVEPQCERLQQLGVRFKRRKTQIYHAEVSALWLHEQLAAHEPGVSRQLVWALRDAMGGHHGRFAQAEMADIRKRLRASEQGESRWATWREASYRLLRDLLAPAGGLAAMGSPAEVRVATVALTGFIVWCDWMGSNEYDFPATPGLAAADYVALARERAQHALDRHHLRAVRPVVDYQGFATLFPGQGPPRPLQALFDQWNAGDLASPSLTLIEAPTGEGKTEAALALARQVAAVRGVDEIFFALPTMATSNQMFGRLRLTLRMMPARDTVAAEAAYLLDLVREGGAVARLCNRVDDAQALYAALKERLPEQSQRMLLHARFPLAARKRGEAWIEANVGKQTKRTAEQPLIVVGTQVLEQSLDYDVDVMVSDMAPIDLLLQRAGRLHRHLRDGKRPQRHREPVLEVVAPLDGDGLPDWQRWAPIYQPYILWRSWAALAARATDGRCPILLPQDYRPLIEAVYGAGPAPDARFADQIAATHAAYLKATKEQEAQARRPLTPEAISSDAITVDGGIACIEEEAGQAALWQLAKTRLGDRVTLVPVYACDDRLALDAAGTLPLSLDSPTDLEGQKEILNHAVPVSDWRLIAAYQAERRPRALHWPWPDLPQTLRGVHPLRLDPTSHAATINGCMVRLDRDLGLVITKAEGQFGPTFEEEL